MDAEKPKLKLLKFKKPKQVNYARKLLRDLLGMSKDIDDLVVVFTDKEGELCIHGSTVNMSDIVFLLERAKHRTIEAHEDKDYDTIA